MTGLQTSRAARMLAGLGANGITQISQLAMRLVEVPVLLGLWGASTYGEWLLIAALPTALSFSDGGFTKAARREMAMRAGRGDELGVEAVFQSAWVLLLILTAIALSLLALCLPFVNLVGLLKLKSIGPEQLDIALLALAAQVLVYFQCGLLHGALASRGKYAIGEVSVAGTLVLCFVGMVVGAATTRTLFGAALGSFTGQVVGYLVMVVVYHRITAVPRYGICAASRTEVKALWSPSIANLAFPVADALNMQGIRLIVGLTLGPSALAVFSTTRTLCRVAMQPILSIGRTLEPELSLLYGSGNNEQARQLFLKASNAGFWLSVFFMCGVAIFGPLMYGYWSDHRLSLSWSSLGFLLIASVLNVLWGIALTVPCAANRHTSMAAPFLILYGAGSAGVTLALSSTSLGIPGAALGVMLGDAIALAYIVLVALRREGIASPLWIRKSLRFPALSSLSLASLRAAAARH